jgi:hypothetical protein
MNIKCRLIRDNRKAQNSPATIKECVGNTEIRIRLEAELAQQLCAQNIKSSEPETADLLAEQRRDLRHKHNMGRESE